MNKAIKNNEMPLADDAYYQSVTEAIRSEAIRLLGEGKVAAVVGYRAGRRSSTALPAIVTSIDQVDQLIFSPACVNNLALYLTRAKQEIKGKGKLALVAKGCDLRAVAGLLGENQLKRDHVHLIGIACAGVYGAVADRGLPLCEATIARKCRECSVHEPTGTDAVAGILPQLKELTPLESAELAKLEAMPPGERWDYWQAHFARCIRCLACRQVCPLCYCEQCLCDKNRPQAVESSPRPAGNSAWHIVRAMHLAGRCSACAECERVCPMDIPLNLLNRKMANELKELYAYEAGLTPQEKGPLTSYKEDDDQSFIK